MKVPISWLKEFVDISIPIEELAHKLTLAGLEVEEIFYVGLPLPEWQETKISGISWAPEEIVVGAVHEVMPHPDADRLVLCKLDDGQQVQGFAHRSSARGSSGFETVGGGIYHGERRWCLLAGRKVALLPQVTRSGAPSPAPCGRPGPLEEGRRACP